MFFSKQKFKKIKASIDGKQARLKVQLYNKGILYTKYIQDCYYFSCNTYWFKISGDIEYRIKQELHFSTYQSKFLEIDNGSFINIKDIEKIDIEYEGAKIEVIERIPLHIIPNGLYEIVEE